MSYRVLGTDRILENSVAPGTGDVTLGTPVPGYRTFFSVLAPNDTCTYFIEAIDANGIPTGDWERGFGTFLTATGQQLVRSGIMDSSNAGNLVNFTSDVRVGSAPMSETVDVNFLPGGRLSVSGTSPVADGESNTLYYIPYYNDDLPLFNGYGLQSVTSASTSISVATLPANSAYDVFGYLGGATLKQSILTLELTAWTSPTVRATNLVYANGFLCKSGDPTRRFLGSIYIGATSGLLQDWANYQGVSQNPSKRFLWNAYNRVRRECHMFDATLNWTVPTDNIWRQIDGLTAPQGCLEFFRGVDDDAVQVTGLINVNVNTNGNYYTALGLDNNTPISMNHVYGNFLNTSNKNLDLVVNSAYAGRPGLGYHQIRLLEKLTGATATAGSDSQSGMIGMVFS
jgi:hypothetical protein